MKQEDFIKRLEELKISYTDDMLKKLKIYCSYLLEYNTHTNLTAIRTEEEVYLKHFYDSLTLVKVVDFTKIKTFADIGSGAGFPGVVLKIFFPHLEGVLIDSNNKKTTFLKSVVDKLELTNIKIVNDRVENFAKKNLNTFDLVTARAVTNMRVLSELCLPLVKVEGFFVAMKGKVLDELKEALNTIDVMGGKIIENQQFSLLEQSSERTLIKIEKKRDTTIHELRNYDKIIKKPLQKSDK